MDVKINDQFVDIYPREILVCEAILDRITWYENPTVEEILRTDMTLIPEEVRCAVNLGLVAKVGKEQYALTDNGKKAVGLKCVKDMGRLQHRLQTLMREPANG
jgi:uncharacterized protein YlaN (UPF0358 family)